MINVASNAMSIEYDPETDQYTAAYSENIPKKILCLDNTGISCENRTRQFKT